LKIMGVLLFCLASEFMTTKINWQVDTDRNRRRSLGGHYKRRHARIRQCRPLGLEHKDDGDKDDCFRLSKCKGRRVVWQESLCFRPSGLYSPILAWQRL
jgi:hypothetical protein